MTRVMAVVGWSELGRKVLTEDEMDAVTERKHRLRMGTVFPFERKRGKVSKGKPFGRHVVTEAVLDWEWSLHATKGWRQENRKRAAARMRMHQMGYGR